MEKTGGRERQTDRQIERGRQMNGRADSDREKRKREIKNRKLLPYSKEYFHQTYFVLEGRDYHNLCFYL